jgi:hypothetical protein
MVGHPVILAVQDTTSVKDDSRQGMEGNGYSSYKIMGINMHNCLSLTPEGLVLGILDKTGFNHAQRKNTTVTREQQKNRPIGKAERPLACDDGKRGA